MKTGKKPPVHLSGREKIRRALTALLILTLLTAAFSLYSHIRFNRSALATVAEIDLRFLITDTSDEALVSSLESLRRQEAPLYTLPSYVPLESSVTEITRDSGLRSIVLEPKDPESIRATIYYLHGGSYKDEPLPFHFTMLDQLIEEVPCRVIMPLYPLIPHSNSHSALPLVLKDYEAVSREVQSEPLILMGDSAGGGLALSLLQMLSAESGDASFPRLLLLLSPWLDLSMENPQIKDYEHADPMLDASNLRICGAYWAMGRSLKDPLISPLYASSGSLFGKDTPPDEIPSLILYTGTREIFYPDIQAFYETLSSAPCRAELYVGEGMNHVFPCYPIPEAKEAIEHMAERIREIE